MQSRSNTEHEAPPPNLLCIAHYYFHAPKIHALSDTNTYVHGIHAIIHELQLGSDPMQGWHASSNSQQGSQKRTSAAPLKPLPPAQPASGSCLCVSHANGQKERLRKDSISRSARVLHVFSTEPSGRTRASLGRPLSTRASGNLHQ